MPLLQTEGAVCKKPVSWDEEFRIGSAVYFKRNKFQKLDFYSLCNSADSFVDTLVCEDSFSYLLEACKRITAVQICLITECKCSQQSLANNLGHPDFCDNY